jgi:NADH-quinone oxidoreductase subunit D
MRDPGWQTRGVSEAAGTRELSIGVGGAADTAALQTADMVLNIGPQHPATHGVLRLKLVVDGERIVSAEPIVGYMHRGAEKLFEVRDYRQIIVLANRHDWLSAFANELGVVLAAEQLLGMEVPPRAVWARTLLAELNRVLNHLMFLGSYPLELGAITPIFYSFREREELQAVMEEISGGRMHYMFNRVGGLKEDLPAGWLDRVLAAVSAVRRRLPDLERLLVGNEILRARTRGVGVLPRAMAAAYGVSGPIARASGMPLDLRANEPYLAYGELFGPGGPGRVVTREEGDCLARFEVLLEQVHVSLDLAEACVDRLRSLDRGPINVRLPKVLRVPEGSVYRWTENPLGLNGYYLVSRGDKTPWRLKLRSASFGNVQALSWLLPGNLIADMVAIIGSTFFVVGDVDK